MKGLNKLALASAVLAISTGAFAMEALQDDALSDTTGQAGLTITTTNTNVAATAIRYYDSDGIGSSATTATTGAGLIANVTANGGTFHSGTSYEELIGPFAGTDPSVIIGTFATDTGGSGGSINISGFALAMGSSTTTIDVGTSSTGTSGLLVGMSGNNINLNLIVSFDSGNELNFVDAFTAATPGAVKNIGGIAVEGLTLPYTTLLVTAGANDLTAFGGQSTSSGLTITPLSLGSLSLTVKYYDTNLQTWDSTHSYLTQEHAGNNSGVLSLPIYIDAPVAGSTEIAAGNAVADANGAGYAGGAGKGLEILTGGFGATDIDIGGEGGHAGTGILLAGSDAGSIGIIGLQVGPQLISISGH